jgi:N-methylhydantoinase A
MQLIGVDTGGTFTDVVVVTEAGRVAVGKALSTPGHVEDGVLAGLQRAAEDLSISVEELLADTAVLAHGTTVGLNALLTGAGARVGLLTTAGFEDTMAIAKANKIHDLPVLDVNTPTRWRKPATLVRPNDIAGITERVDSAGQIVTALDDDQARDAIDSLVARGVESLAVCLLWSPANGEHEDRIRELAREAAPGLRVTVSHQLASRIGEYERMSTAVIDAYVAPLVSSYLERLEDRLRDLRFGGAFLVMRMGGGVQPAALARRHPIHTLRSGPAGGVGAAQQLGAADGHPNVIATDVGGTSFDVGLVVDGEPRYARRPTVDRLPLATRAVDIESIGTGGGSIAWLDETLGALRVGPQTAAADPGPACYGLGGTAPTLTDAAVVLGYVERLGGTLHLDRDAAAKAIDRSIAGPLGMGVAAAAEGIVRVACEQMRDLVRRSTIQRGFDPADFVLMAYGGAGPQYAAQFASDLGVQQVIIPSLAASLSAFGALSGDLRVRADRDQRPGLLTETLADAHAALTDLEPEVRAQLHGSGRDADIATVRTIGLRFYRQIHRIDVACPPNARVAELTAAFHARYEQVIGPGTAPGETPVEVVSVAVEAQLRTPVPALLPRGSAPAAVVRSTRAIFDGRRHECPIFRWPELGAGQVLTGPAFVEDETTTAVIPPGRVAVVGATGNLVLDLRESS